MGKKIEQQSIEELNANKKKYLTIFKVVAVLFFMYTITIIYLTASKTIPFQLPLITASIVFIGALLPAVTQIKAIEKELEKRNNK
ncbi:MAG: hypothetical protein Q8K02_18735 [Flavobacterium sp.]|nr:hypothetical protein [Flavobacterium sp.]